jgi:hypothetical protein
LWCISNCIQVVIRKIEAGAIIVLYAALRRVHSL